MSLNQSLISDFSEYYRWSQRTKIKYKLHYGWSFKCMSNYHLKVDWTKRDKELFQLWLVGSKLRFVSTVCRLIIKSPFCPSQIDQQLPSSSKYSTMSSRIVSNTEPTKDSHGRQGVFFRGKEACNNFNSVGGCWRMTRSFTQICKRCKG